MNKLEELILKYCPEGVKRVKLGEVCQILDSQRKPVAKGHRSGGIYPYYGANGVLDYVDGFLFDGTFLLIGEDGSVINEDKSPVLHWAEGKIWVNNHAHIVQEIKGKALLRYLYYALQHTDVSDIVRGTPPKINQANLRDISIPLPPLPVQEEIVRMLDAMSELQENLEKELEERRKQFAYYRDKLMTFNDLTTPPSQRIEWKQLGEICKVNIGEFVHKDKQTLSGMYPVYNGGISYTGFYEKYNIEGPCVLVSARGANAGYVNRVNDNFWAGNSCYAIKINVCGVQFEYIYEYLKYAQNTLMQSQQKGGGIPAISKQQMESFSIPLPPLAVQEEITEKLDKMEELINNIESELTERKKQYEYYREKLFLFAK